MSRISRYGCLIISNMNTAKFLIYTIFPLGLCLLFVHCLFRHVSAIAWVAVKVALAVVVYVHVQDTANSYIGRPTTGMGVFCIESNLFGLPPGSINIAASLGFNILKSKARKLATETCPSCFGQPVTPPVPPCSAFQSAVDETRLVVRRGVDWVIEMSSWDATGVK